MEGTKEERRAAGRELRRAVPRSAHAHWRPGATRPDPVEVLEAQAASRIDELVPVRYGRMAESPFAFFRGGAAIMAADLASTPVTGLRVQACGDAHVSNFGEFATPERNVVFDINDFDETIPGPWEWDVKRLAASLHVVARQSGASPSQCDEVVATALRDYRERLAEYTTMRALDLWYDRIHIDDVITHFPRRYRPLVKRDVKKARRKTHRRAVAKLTKAVGTETRFVEDPPVIVHLDNTEVEMAEVMTTVDNYRLSLTEERRELFDRYQLVDVARRAVGVGSVGTACWIVLLEGPDHPGGDPIVLQVKEAQPSVLEPYVGQSHFEHEGLRVVTGQRLTQAASDLFLGWTSAPRTGRHYYVRQLWDVKGQGDPTAMDVRNLTYYGALCGWALARAHARTGDAVTLAAYLGGSDRFDRAVVAFAAAYADTNERDYAGFLAAGLTGRIVIGDPHR